MSQARRPLQWRSAAGKMIVLVAIWLVLATIFSAQFYWIGRDWPLQITWKESFRRALLEWWPWLILSPLVVWLAERFRFDRTRRLRGVSVHLPACLLVALAYQGIAMLFTQQQTGVFIHNTAGSVRVIHGGAGLVQGFGIGSQPAPPPPFELPFGEGITGMQNVVTIHRTNLPMHGVSSGSAPAGGIGASFPPAATFIRELPPKPLPPLPGPVTRYLQLAASRAQSTLPIYWAMVCVTWVFSYYQQLGERERRTLELEARLTQANLQTLKTQLQPHFLFNTLNAIASRIRRSPEAAEDMIGSLSDFLRMNLEATPHHEVPLRREIEFLDPYLEIQRIRFGERLQVQKEIDPAALDVLVPTLILQPLVENSVRHGIEPRESGGVIRIRASRSGNLLRLEVRDDGAGLKGGQLAAIREGIGLSNTKARLQELYGTTHHFHITPNADRGLTVIVDVPWVSAKQDENRKVLEPAAKSGRNFESSEVLHRSL